MKKILILFILTLTLSGCMGYTELNKISVVKSLLIDYKNDEYIINADVILDNKENYKTISSSGKTLDDVFNNAYQKFYKKLYMSHTELILLTTDAIDYKLEEIIDYFLKNTTTRNNFNLALVEDKSKLLNNNKNDAKDKNNDNESSNDKISENKENDNNEDNELKLSDLNEYISIIESETATTKTINFEEFIKDLYETKRTYLPIVVSNDTLDGIYLIDNYKLFNKLSKDETIIYNYIYNNVNTCKIDDITVSDNQTVINKNKNIDILIKSTINKNNKEYKKILEKQIKDLYNKYKDLNYDIFNFENKKLNIDIKGENKNEKD